MITDKDERMGEKRCKWDVQKEKGRLGTSFFCVLSLLSHAHAHTHTNTHTNVDTHTHANIHTHVQHTLKMHFSKMCCIQM